MNIPINTVFNPTVNGGLHLGHVYMMLVNEAETRAGNGKFYVRFDDTQPYWSDRCDWKDIAAYKDTIRADAEWLGVHVDGFYSQSEMHYEAHKRLVTRCHDAGIPVPRDRYGDTQFPEVAWNNTQPYPFTAYKTAEKCIFDDMLDISLKVRGEDLYGEFALYCYFRDVFRMYQPRQVFLPRLIFSQNGNTGEVSKTASNFRISDLRQISLKPEAVLRVLADACLKDPLGAWRIENVKPNPTLIVGEMYDRL